MDVLSWLEANEESVDSDDTPRERSGRALSFSDIGSYSSNNSRTSPARRLAKLEHDPDGPVFVRQIVRTDDRMPAELQTLLSDLDSFQYRNGIVPHYLEADIRTSAEHDRNFFNFTPSTFERSDEAIHLPAFDPQLSLHRILEVFESAAECFNEGHAQATWNTLVHWPVFRLALGPIANVSGRAQAASISAHGIETAQPASAPEDQTEGQGRENSVRIRGMLCTAARLTGHARGPKLVNYCIFVEPELDEAVKIDELRGRWKYINHTDYNPLRRRPVVLSAEAMKPSGGFTNAHLQLGIWQTAQWNFLLGLLAEESRGTQVPVAVAFLSALIIRGNDWYFAASTRVKNETILWVQQPIGGTGSILGIFQIIHALRHIASWVRTTYWPWYKRAILHLPAVNVAGNAV
ncbi:hypothetical protein F5Y10DRAFT_150717 [Nemania abortiva]|nr:hypothetical protein F5Y10DRAFT_150717 [Nemania abortiva]